MIIGGMFTAGYLVARGIANNQRNS
jgi:hypothetical protein